MPALGVTVPFSCAICGSEFPLHRGGQCVKCRRLICSRDLVHEGTTAAVVCKECVGVNACAERDRASRSSILVAHAKR